MDATPVTLEALRAIATRHGTRLPSRLPRAWGGATSRVYPLGEVVVKVPHAAPAAVAAVRTDALVVDAARSVGVTAPRLLALDEGCDLLPVPYSVHERVHGRTLARMRGAASSAQAWRSVGRELARAHTGVKRAGTLAGLRAFAQSAEVDPRPWLAELADTGVCPPRVARWLGRLLDELAPAALAPVPQVFCHGDVNGANVLVAREGAGAARFLALIDWAGAGWLDPAWDFASVPLRVVPAMLAGHREVAPVTEDATAEARILWCHLQSGLHILHTGGLPTEARQRRLEGLVRRARDYARTSQPGVATTGS